MIIIIVHKFENFLKHNFKTKKKKKELPRSECAYNSVDKMVQNSIARYFTVDFIEQANGDNFSFV